MIYVTGDLHGELERLKAPGVKKLRRGDTLLVCGDFGFIWDGDKKEQRILKKLGRKRFHIAFVDGIHENHNLLSAYPVTEWCGGKVHHISGRLYHLMRGQVYHMEDKTIFTMGGGELPETADYDERFAACLPTVDDLYEANENLQRVDYRVDAVITHDCNGVVKNFLNMDCDACNHVYAFLDNASRIMEYDRWYFGCHHMDKQIPPRYTGVYREVLSLCGEHKAPGRR